MMNVVVVVRPASFLFLPNEEIVDLFVAVILRCSESVSALIPSIYKITNTNYN